MDPLTHTLQKTDSKIRSLWVALDCKHGRASCDWTVDINLGVRRTTGVNLWLFSEAHTYERTSVDYRDVLSMNAHLTLLHYASLDWGSVMWTMLCEGEGWGKGKVPWDRTYTMVTHFDRLILPRSIDHSTNTGANMDSLVFHVFTFHSSLISLHLVW